MFNDFKPVLKILLRFIIIYLVLLFGYQFYLKKCTEQGLDPFSVHVANLVAVVQDKLGYPTLLYNDTRNDTVWFYVNNQYATRMVEGCNAISIIILFVSFVFAFYKGGKTFVFAGLGVLLIYVINILRIVGLNIVVLDFPKYGKSFHDYVFPAIIYGTVVVLWLVWIKFFALKKE